MCTVNQNFRNGDLIKISIYLKFVRTAAQKHPNKEIHQDLPGGQVVRSLPSSAGGAGSVPDGELRSHMPVCQKTQNVKQKQCCEKFSKHFYFKKGYIYSCFDKIIKRSNLNCVLSDYKWRRLLKAKTARPQLVT